MWLQLWGTNELFVGFLIDHLVFFVGCVSAFVCLLFVARVSKDGQFVMGDNNVLKLAQFGSLGAYAFWFIACIMRLGVFFGWLVAHFRVPPESASESVNTAK